MNLCEAENALEISRNTLNKYRKLLKIFEETKENITQKQLNDMKKLRNLRKKNTKLSELVIKSKTLIKKQAKDIGEPIKINEFDQIKMKNLKKQYNNNLKIMNYMNKFTENQIKNNEIPEKYLIDTMERYQLLNIKILNTIKKLFPEISSLEKIIKEKLNSYI